MPADETIWAGGPNRDPSFAAARSFYRALKLLLRGDPYRARHVLEDAWVRWQIPQPAAPPWLADVCAQIAPGPTTPEPLPAPVDIVIPVHDGLRHLRRLFATLFDHTDAQHRFLLADDASTDPAVAALLAAVAARPNVRMLRSETNLGFVATINRAMAEVSGHAILLNTDTEVPRGWVERLMRPIVGETRIASATPFSNSAAMFGFPLPERVNPLPTGLTLRQLDAAFARLSPTFDPSLVAPTGIGFCMGVNRAAWQTVGPFDAATFGRGYGEETDWCLRAAAAGWRNVLAPNLFVYHADAGTFGSAEKRAILDRNLRALHRRWPGYHRELASFRRRDPWATRRCAVILALAMAKDADPLVLVGAETSRADRDRRAAEALVQGRGVIRIAPTATLGHVLVQVRRGDCAAALRSTCGRYESELEGVSLIQLSRQTG